MDGFTNRDIEVLRTTLAAGVVPKVKPFFDMVRQELNSRIPLLVRNYSFERFKEADLWDAPAGHAIYDWCYLKPEQKWYLSWGLTGNAREFFGLSHSDSAGMLAFVYIGDCPKKEYRLTRCLRNTSNPVLSQNGCFLRTVVSQRRNLLLILPPILQDSLKPSSRGHASHLQRLTRLYRCAKASVRPGKMRGADGYYDSPLADVHINDALVSQ